MATPEGIIANNLRLEARAKGLFIRKCRWEGRVGAPDYLILRNGKAFFIETKAPGEKPRRSQLVEFGKILENSCPVFVVDSLESAKKVIEAICESC